MAKGPKEAADFFDRLGKFISERALSNEALDQMGAKAVEMIVRRTRTGIDANGRPFKAYNPSYAAAKGKSVVNLTDTGDMLDSLMHEVEGERLRIFFGDGEQEAKASFHNFGTRHLPVRQFMDLQQSEIQELAEIAAQDFANALAKAS